MGAPDSAPRSLLTGVLPSSPYLRVSAMGQDTDPRQGGRTTATLQQQNSSQ